MTKISRLTLTALTLFSCSAFAGSPDFKQVAPAPPPCDYGTGFYLAIEGGANVYQSFDGSRSKTFGNGDVLEANLDHNVGGYGGIKLGYVFGKEKVRFA